MTTHPWPGFVVAAPAALALLLGACGGEKQMHAAAPPPPVETVGQTNMQPQSIPNTPTAASVNISPEVLRACNIPDSNAYFAFDSSRLTQFDEPPLDALAACFTQGPMAGRKLDLVGRADPRGTPEYNMTLGQYRSDAVSLYLVSHGVQQSQISSTSRGAMDAIGQDETGWAHDRRVDVMLAH